MRSLLLLDPWPPEQEAAIQIDSAETGAGEVDAAVETGVWKAVPAAPVEGRTLFFVDGVRRVEARVLAFHEAGMVHGLFASVATGAVRCADSSAVFEAVRVARYLILSGGLRRAVTLWIGECPVPFEGVGSAATVPLDLAGDLQNLMREAEAAMGESLLAPISCVFVDGPLTYFSTATQPLVGMIKRIYVPYLDAARFALVAQLRTGERTPLFAIRDGQYDRYSWFLRLAEGRSIDHPLAGVARLEVRAAAGLEAASELAGLSAACLPRFASSPLRDPRAPQNLLPVGALEEELRRRLGDALLFRRAIEARLAEGVTL